MRAKFELDEGCNGERTHVEGMELKLFMHRNML